MDIGVEVFSSKSRLEALLDRFLDIEDPRVPWRVMYRLREILFLVVCGTIRGCGDYEHIAAWGETHLGFVRRYLPFERGVPCGRWLTVFMNRIDPGLFQDAFTAFGREAWPDRQDLIAIKPARRRPGARPRGAATAARKAWPRCISYRLSPPPPGWCSGNRRWRRSPTRSMAASRNAA